MASDVPMTPELEQIDGEIHDIFRALQNGFQKMDKIKDSNRQAKQLEDLTVKMKECKRLIKEFDRILKDEESNNPPEINKQLNDRKQFMIKELNSYVTLRKTYQSSLGNNNKRVELFDMGAGSSEPAAEDNIQMASAMTNQQLIDTGRNQMDQTDQAIERSKMVVAQTVETGAQTAATLTQQVATDKCIMAFLFLIVLGVIAIIVVKIVHPNNKNIRDIPGLAPPAQNYQIHNRRLLWAEASIGM
ncbi:putative plant SNARE 13 [Zea mays]|uniref:Putative plant SNARE 13 n=1 Tax=Zea mays TaxID=4577 RepID=A0A1D6K435_MAIZE|nr:putative plant SNARE 13 [Zea mays]